MTMNYKGSVEPEVTILRRGVDITFDSRATVSTDFKNKSISLTIKGLKAEDTGTYTVELTVKGQLCDSAAFSVQVQDR